MRVLFYGGCHADVLHKIFARFCLQENYSGKLLTNYLLINEKNDFPYEILKDFDYIVYNPILNKGNFNTDVLKRYCDKIGLKTICYPWVQWQGYAPKSKKIEVVDWVYSDLIENRNDFSNFQDYKYWALNLRIDETDIENNFNFTTNYLQEHEKKGECDLTISEFILENYKRHHLFVTPDHPSTFTYIFLSRKIAELMNVSLDESLNLLHSEIQSEHFLPIFPKVEQVLGLSFTRSEYSFNNLLGPKPYSLNEWLKIFYYGGDGVVMLTPEWGEFVIAEGGAQIPIDSQQYIFAQPKGDCFKVLSAPDILERSLPANRLVKLGGEWWQRRELGSYKM